MSSGNRKSPFSDVTDGDEKDWDKAINAWEVPDGSPAASGKDPPAAAAKVSKPPPTAPPRPTSGSRPTTSGASSRPGSSSESDLDAATAVAAITPGLLAAVA